MTTERLAWVAAAALAFVALVQTLRLWLLRGAAARRLAVARKRGRAGERAALALLEGAGYRIEALQPPLEWTITCDGEAVPVMLRADLLVSRDGRRFVAEVKTGDQAADLQTPSTRRQLLEYAIAYAVDGALLVDVEGKRIREVAFPRPERGPGYAGKLIAAAVACAGLWLLLQELAAH